VIGQVATQDRDVRTRGGCGQHRYIGVGAVPAEMQIGERDEPDWLSQTVLRGLGGQLHILPRKK